MSETTCLFAIGNHQIAECNDPPAMPPGLDEGKWQASYFENTHGEQSVFYRNRKTNEVLLYMGDLGWDQKLTPLLVDLRTFVNIVRKADIGGLASQFLMAGLMTVARVLGSESPAVVLVLNSRGCVVTLNGEESLWVHACLLAGRQTREPCTDEAKLAKIVADYAAFAKDDEEEEDDDE